MKIRLVLCLVLAVVAAAAFAQTEADFGVTLNDAGDGVVITQYTGKALAVRIPATLQGMPVKEIGKRAFYGFLSTNTKNITSVVIPAGVTKIGDEAFGWQEKLASVTIPDSVAEIGTKAFQCCYALAGIVLPKNITVIKADTFYGCTSLISVTLPEGLIEIENHSGSYPSGAFGGCTKLTSIKIPDGVTRIGSLAFDNCKTLATVIIPASVTEIGVWAFRGCEALTTVTIPATVEIIGGIGMAFTNCPKLNLAAQALIKKLAAGKRDELLAGKWRLVGNAEEAIKTMELLIDGTGKGFRPYSFIDTYNLTWGVGNGRFCLDVYSGTDHYETYSGVYNVSELPHTLTLTSTTSQGEVRTYRYER
jgi:hypothetical protein